jgi:hypothetical protein
LAIWAFFVQFFEKKKSGRFTGFSGNGFRETEVESGFDLGWEKMHWYHVGVFNLPGKRAEIHNSPAA